MEAGVESHIKSKPYEVKIKKKYNNYILMLAFFVTSISIAFLALTVTYLISKQWDTKQLSIPLIFYIDTLIIILGSLALHQASKAFVKDDTLNYKSSLNAALLTSIAFLIGQVVGWIQLATTGYSLTESRSSSFLYVVSGLHAIHIVGGIIVIGFIVRNANSRLKDEILNVVYFSDPLPKARLKLMNYYWHFLGALWLYLLIFFSIVR